MDVKSVAMGTEISTEVLESVLDRLARLGWGTPDMDLRYASRQAYYKVKVELQGRGVTVGLP